MVSGALGKISIDCAYLSQWRIDGGVGGGSNPPP
jgi:hypothetical protein